MQRNTPTQSDIYRTQWCPYHRLRSVTARPPADFALDQSPLGFIDLAGASPSLCGEPILLIRGRQGHSSAFFPGGFQTDFQIMVFMCSTWSCIAFAASLISSTDAPDFHSSTIFCS